jgi:hypothetical protein
MDLMREPERCEVSYRHDDESSTYAAHLPASHTYRQKEKTNPYEYKIREYLHISEGQGIVSLTTHDHRRDHPCKYTDNREHPHVYSRKIHIKIEYDK